MKGNIAFCFNLSLVMIIVFIISQAYPAESLMLKPKTLEYLPGIFTSSFLHESWKHLFYNIGSFLLLYLFLIKEKQITRPWFDVSVIIILSNAALFFIGDPQFFYLGASNLVYGLASYSLLSLIINRKYLLLIPLVILSTLIYSGLTTNQLGVSYLSHYLGAGSGVALFIAKNSMVFKTLEVRNN